MKIVLLHPVKSTNTGDLVILKGAENLLKEAYGEVEFLYQDLDGGLKPQAADLFVVSGTPWFWEVCHRSEKYEKLKNVLELYPKAKKVGLGLGACYPLTTNTFSKYIYPDPAAVKQGFGDWRLDDIQRIQNRFEKFDLLITRDRVAQEVLKTAGLESHETVCPACFAFDVRQNKVLDFKPLLIFQDPAKGVSKVACDKDFSEQYTSFQMALHEKFNMDIVTSSPVDCDWLRDVAELKSEIDRPYSSWMRNVPDLLGVLESHNPIVSCRVHDAIPARMMGKLTYILPMDTRYLTAVKVGAMPMCTYGFSEETIESLDFTWDSLDKVNAITFKKVENDKAFLIEKLRGIL